MLYSIVISALLVASKAQDACGGFCEFIGAAAGIQAVCDEVLAECVFVECDGDAGCTTAPFDTCLNAAFFTGMDSGICIDACLNDAECVTRAEGLGANNTANIYCITDLGICTEGESCSDTMPCYDDTEVCDNGVCKSDFCTSDAECDTNYVCVTGILGEDIGICSAEICKTDAQCQANFNSTFLCAVGIFEATEEIPIPAEFGACAPNLCRRQADCARAEELKKCVTELSAFGGEASMFEDIGLGLCIETECFMDSDCEEPEEDLCVLTAFGGACAQSCGMADVGNMCRDGDDAYTCQLIEANSVRCGFPYLDSYVCLNETVPVNDSLSCPEPTPFPTTAVPTMPPTTAEEASSGVHTVVFGVMAVIAGALASM